MTGDDLGAQLATAGYAVLRGLFGTDTARAWGAALPDGDLDEPAMFAAWTGELRARLAPIVAPWSWQAAPQRTCIRRLRTSEYQPLQQSEGFPVRLLAVLSEPGVDFDGGELILTERRPRLQSRPYVVPLRLGDAALVATGRRPRADSSVYTKYGIGRVRRGERIGLEIAL